uniref:Uncharacterized protein n=1 Tax=Rhizophora mucronata TaxID=61149 RepID=A0A2P2IHS1_RHIMU
MPTEFCFMTKNTRKVSACKIVTGGREVWIMKVTKGCGF